MSIKVMSEGMEIEIPEEEYYAEVHEAMDPILLNQKPYVHQGMTVGEYYAEREYYRNNWDKVRDHTYVPLWQQKEEKEKLLNNLSNLHTTELGVVRIKRNLSLDTDNVVDWCKTKINSANAVITSNGKNWYVNVDNCIITINAYSITIITAHKEKKSR